MRPASDSRGLAGSALVASSRPSLRAMPRSTEIGSQGKGQQPQRAFHLVVHLVELQVDRLRREEVVPLTTARFSFKSQVLDEYDVGQVGHRNALELLLYRALVVLVGLLGVRTQDEMLEPDHQHAECSRLVGDVRAVDLLDDAAGGARGGGAGSVRDSQPVS